MASFKESDFEPVDHFSQDLARYRASAANALKNFERTYNDVMGFDNDNVSVNSLSFEDLSLNPTSSLSLDSDNHNEDGLFFNHTEFNHHDFSTSSYFTSYRRNTCFRCHRDMTRPETELCIPAYNFRNIQMKPPCQNCSQINSNYSHRTRLPTPDVELPVQHPPVSSVTQNSTSENSSSKTDIHKCPLKITVPEPFQMTIRDEGQKLIKELKIRQLKEKLDKEAEKELYVKIYSNPVPGHVYVPLFEKMTEMDNIRKEQRRKKSAERTHEMIKPFNFSVSRKNELRRADSMPNLQSDEPTHIFKAKPVPTKMLNQNYSQRLKYKEETRKFRISKRAKEMLMQSSLPFSANRILCRSASCVNVKQNENVNKTPYKTQQRTRKKSYHKTMSRGQCQKVMNDWNVKVMELTCTRKHEKEDTDKIEEGIDLRFHNFLRAKKSTLFDGAVRATSTYYLREHEIRKESEAKNKENTTADAENRKWQKELRGRLQTKLHDTTITNFEKDLEAKLQNYRASRRMRQIEYERELMEIQKRIEKQPLLIDRQSKVAKKDKSTSTEPQDMVTPGSNTASNRTLSLASSLASQEYAKSSSHSSLSNDSEHSL